jgi:hypothetical protein
MRLAASCRVVAAMAGLLIVAGCGDVITTSGIDLRASASEPACHSALGYYFLPRTLLSVTAKADQGASLQTATLASGVYADRRQAFCLDYLSSATSIDAVTVKRNERGLLVSITSAVEDRTPQIAATLVQTAENFAIAASRTGSTAGAPPPDQLTIQFDPFVWEDLIMANEALRRFDFCLYVEGYSFSTEGLDPEQVRKAASGWCATSPRREPRYEPRVYAFANLPVDPEVMRQGVLYRPLATHKVVLLHKREGRWELYQTKRYDMPNASPVLSIGVERALFTKRSTAIYFDQGSLSDVAVEKGSELESFVTIPLAVAKAVVDVPSQILQIRLADTQSHAALIQAQGNLLNAINSYASLMASQNPSSPGRSAPQRSADFRNGEFVAGCLDANGPPETCRTMSGAPR